MKLLQVWKRIGKQSLKITRHKDAVAIIDGEEYPITSIKYNNGVFVGFEVDMSKNKEEHRCIYEKNCPTYAEYCSNKIIGTKCIPFILAEYSRLEENCKELIKIIDDISKSTLGENWYITDPVNNMQASEIIRDEIHDKYYNCVNHKIVENFVVKIFKTIKNNVKKCLSFK